MIPLHKVLIAGDALEKIGKTLHSGMITEADRVKEFEALLTEYFGVQVLTMNSCTSAIDMALHLIGVGGGDQIISSPMTCAASNTHAVLRKAKLIWCDVNKETGCAEPESIGRLVTDKTKAIIVVDWGGRPVDCDIIRQVLPRPIPIIQDAAHSFGALSHGMPAHATTHSAEYTCFVGSAKIETTHGAKRIDQIAIGDKVLTQSGKFHSVCAVHKNKYKGNWTRITAGQTRLFCTENHPVLTHRNGRDEWIPAKEVTTEDWVYVKTRMCAKCDIRKIPFYGRVCKECYDISDSSMLKRLKVQTCKWKLPRKTSRNDHHNQHVAPWMEKYKSNGYRVIPFIYAFPDFVALKDGKIVAVEVESASSVRLGKSKKYDKLGIDGYDDIHWITRPKKRVGSRYSFEIVGDLARVRVSTSKTSTWKSNYSDSPKTNTVFNLTVEKDPTYFANGVLVHNCWSFQAIKHLTTGDGGALKVPSDQIERARRLRWFGIDRDTKAKFRFLQDIKEAGFKYHMNDLTASLGIANLPFAKASVYQHRENAAFLLHTLGDCKKIELPPRDSGSSWWFFSLLMEKPFEFIDFAEKRGVAAGPVHGRNDHYTAHGKSDIPLPGVDYYMAHHVAIPCGWWLSQQDLEKIVEVVKEWDAI